MIQLQAASTLTISLLNRLNVLASAMVWYYMPILTQIIFLLYLNFKIYEHDVQNV